ncbi:hypothetical protein J4463_00930 [Candidatus Pacearchaeota archaeon]|nr:hypothetical protein [Candidatus Pacearchaeota archaeon]
MGDRRLSRLMAQETEPENEAAIKRGLNIYLYYWTIPVFLIFILINYYTPILKIGSLDIGLMISIVTFLFGFLITVTFSMLLTRVSSLKDALATETGRLASIFLLSKHLGTKFNQAVRQRIDDYTIFTLREYTNYSLSRESIYGIHEDISLMELKTSNQQAAANSFLYILGELEPIREKLEYLTGRRVEWSLRFTNLILGTILIILLFLNRGDAFSNALFVILSTIIIFILFILEDYDNLKIGDYITNISNSEQLFDLIGTERYYPEFVLRGVKLERGKTYRIGIYDPSAKAEKIFRITYNPKFFFRVSEIIRRVRRKSV